MHEFEDSKGSSALSENTLEVEYDDVDSKCKEDDGEGDDDEDDDDDDENEEEVIRRNYQNSIQEMNGMSIKV